MTNNEKEMFARAAFAAYDAAAAAADRLNYDAVAACSAAAEANDRARAAHVAWLAARSPKKPLGPE